MDDDENKPGITQTQLIQDLVFDPSLPLKPPGKRSGLYQKPSQSPSRKSGPYPPGYDPETVDLFEDIVDPVELADEDDRDTQVPDLTQETGNPESEIEENLRVEVSDELGTILEHLKDHPEA
jgi:hypothetical protein